MNSLCFMRRDLSNRWKDLHCRIDFRASIHWTSVRRFRRKGSERSPGAIRTRWSVSSWVTQTTITGHQNPVSGVMLDRAKAARRGERGWLMAIGEVGLLADRIFAQRPTRSPPNAAGLALIPLSRFFMKSFLDKPSAPNVSSKTGPLWSLAYTSDVCVDAYRTFSESRGDHVMHAALGG